MTGYVYILEMNNGKYYIGSSINVSRRFAEHSRGNVDSTRHNRPLKFMFYKEFETIQEAQRKELRLKKQKSKNIVNLFISAG